MLADLQTAVALPAEAPEVLTAILGNQTHRGRWRVPARLAARSVLGDCHIELQDAVLTAPVTTIQARTTLGSVTIFVPEGVEVRLSERRPWIALLRGEQRFASRRSGHRGSGPGGAGQRHRQAGIL
jgi:hypothetical protein